MGAPDCGDDGIPAELLSCLKDAVAMVGEHVERCFFQLWGYRGIEAAMHKERVVAKRGEELEVRFAHGDRGGECLNLDHCKSLCILKLLQPKPCIRFREHLNSEFLM